MQNNNKIDITVIIPALNEEKNIISAINDCRKIMKDLNLRGEIIVVNDGSKDKTEELVKGVMNKNNQVKMIKHEVAKGVGTSFWDGVKQARGKAVTCVPGDNENDLREILRYFSLLDHADVIVPFICNKEVRTLFRNALSSIYCRIINTSFGFSFNYTNGGVLYRKSVLSQVNLKSKGFFFQTEILIKLAKNGYLFAEVPCRLRRKMSKESKAVSFRSLLRVISGYLKLFKDIYLSKVYKKNILANSATGKRLNKDQGTRND